jgi:CheY-like chemotaxis protein
MSDSETRRSILIIDDHEPLAEKIAAALNKKGYDAPHFQTIKEAIDYLKQNRAPTFILADRWISEPIETRNLEWLSRVALTSKIIVYTQKIELSPEAEDEILRKGAYRVLDKGTVDGLIADITVLTEYLEELQELEEQLNRIPPERNKFMAALVGSGVEVTIVDRYFHVWYSSTPHARSMGTCRDLCRNARARERSRPADPACWGCTIKEVVDQNRAVEGVYLNRLQNGSVRWVDVRSTPILRADGTTVLATREAVTTLSETSINNLPRDQRLHLVAQSLIRLGFGQARIYEAVTDTEIRLVSAAARSDDPLNPQSAYRSRFGDATQIDISRCPYTRQAKKDREGCFVPEWDLMKGKSPFLVPLGLKPPYFDVPIWGKDDRLAGWICVDFGGVAADAVEKDPLVRKESLRWLQEEYGREVLRALESGGGQPERQKKFQIVQDARFGVAGATSVADATEALRRAFGKLFPDCRVSVRMRHDDGSLEEFESLCVGESVGEKGPPTVIQGNNSKSLTAYVAEHRVPLWLADFAEYRRTAPQRGLPEGYPREGTQSTAQLPLLFENKIVGTLSVDSPGKIQWYEDGYQEPLLALAKVTCLVLRDLVLEKKRVEGDESRNKLAALTAYAVSATGDPLWRHWAHQRLAEATLLVNRARRILEAGKPAPDCPKLDELLVNVSATIQKVNSSRPGAEAPVSSVADVFERLKETYADQSPEPVFNDASTLLRVRVPPFVLRSALTVLLDNSVKALRATGSSIKVTARKQDDHVQIDVEDDGPGVPESERPRILREPVHSRDGLGLGLLIARGAALQYGGDLKYLPTSPGCLFTFIFPTAFDEKKE